MAESYFEKMLQVCDNHTGSCSTCTYYKECLQKYKLSDKSQDNNPSTMSWEIKNAKLLDGYTGKKMNFNVNICEAPDKILKRATEFAERLPNEEKRLVISGIEKFVASSDEDATIIQIKDNLYHFVFECSDCFAKNDFTDYCLNDVVSFHCRYCGKKHTFDLAKIKESEKKEEDKNGK